MNELIEKIKKLKKEKNAVILAHCYQNVEIDEVADYVGDSLYLSQRANETNADIIVFAGVYFMAQTAKLLSPDKKVLLPRMESGCRMADMIDLEQVKEFKSLHPNIPASKGGDLEEKEILFLPDTYLGKWVEAKLGNIKITTYPGFCPTHLQIKPKDILEAREKYPNAKVLAHPECHQEVVKLADYVGSTTGIMKYAIESDNKQFIIATEKGVVDRLKIVFL